MTAGLEAAKLAPIAAVTSALGNCTVLIAQDRMTSSHQPSLRCESPVGLRARQHLHQPTGSTPRVSRNGAPFFSRGAREAARAVILLAGVGRLDPALPPRARFDRRV